MNTIQTEKILSKIKMIIYNNSKKIYNGKNVIRTEIDKYTEKDIINEIREVLNNTNVK